MTRNPRDLECAIYRVGVDIGGTFTDVVLVALNVISTQSNLAMPKMAAERVPSALAGAPTGAIANPDVLGALR